MKSKRNLAMLASAAAAIPHDLEVKALHDIMDRLDFKRAISPLVAVDNTAFVSQIIDTRDYSACMFAIATGTLADADATFTVLLEEGDQANLSDNAVPNANYVNGSVANANFIFSDDDKVRKIGYTGIKRYIRLTITPANNTGNAPVAAIFIGVANRRATPNPPV